MQIYELDRFELSDKNGMYGGKSGTKEGIVIDGEKWLVKYPKKADRLKDVENMSYTSMPESEYIGSHVYEILGYPVHQTIIGIRHNHVVVGCKDLCDNGQILIEFRQLKNTYNEILNEQLDRSMSSTGSDHFVVLEEVMTHLKYNPLLSKVSGLKERFWDCVVIDGLINNNDRNNGNWGLLRKQGQADLVAPIFDNGASFSPNVPEEKMLHKLNDEKIFSQSACSNVTAYSIDGNRNALYRDIINLDIPELNKAIKKNVPLIKNNMERIKQMIDDIPSSVGEYKIVSEERKSVYKKEMEIRLAQVLVPAYDKIISNEMKIRREQGGYDAW